MNPTDNTWPEDGGECPFPLRQLELYDGKQLKISLNSIQIC
jgi:hypothetical protein